MVPRAQTFGAVLHPASVRGAGWELAAAGLVRALLWLGVPVLVLQVFDRALPAAQADDLILLALAVAGVLAIRGGLDLVAAALADAWDQARLRDGIQASVSRLFAGASADVSHAPPDLPKAVPAGPPAGLVLAGLPVLLAALAYLAGMMAAPVFILAVIAAISGHLIQRAAARPADARSGLGSEFAGRILDAIWTVKAIGAESLVLRLAENAARLDAGAARNRIRPRLSADRWAALFDRVTLVLAVLTGTVLCVNGVITAGQLAAGTLIAVALVRDAYRGGAALALPRLHGEVGAVRESGEGTPPEPLPRVTGNLMLNRVRFDEPADGLRTMSRMLFDRIRIEIEAGEAVLITGGDVHMRTALLRLMAGLEHPQSGTVSVDGYDLSAHRPDSVRRQIAYVPPLGDVLPGTLLENLTGFAPGRAADALSAARLTGLDVKAASLADGFDTRLEGGAAGFPAGFRQHLAVTRALAAKPKVLLLDHATENLDSQDLRIISEVLERLKGRVTIVFASTQAGLRAMADREIDLDALTPAPEIGAAGNDDNGENAEDSDNDTDGEG